MTALDGLPGQARDLSAQGARLLTAWGDELAALLPARLRMRRRPPLTAEPLPAGQFRFTLRGRDLAAAPRAGRGPLAVTLRLPDQAVLVCETPAPDVSDADVARMLSLDVDRLTPFEAADVFIAVAVRPGRGSDGRRHALLAAAPKAGALELLARARQSGLDPRAVVAHDRRAGFPPLDFTASMRSEIGGRDVGPLRMLWLLAALLACIDLAVLVNRDVARTRDLRAQAQALHPRLVLGQRLRDRVLAEEARRRALVAGRRAAEPLRVLEALSRDLPDGAWVEHMNWNGQVVRLSGYRREGVDVAAALRSTADFRDVRNATADVRGGSAAGIPFDVTARPAAAGP